MDEAEEILLGSLRSFGIALPSGNPSTLNDFSSDTLVSVCVQFLRLFDRGGSSHMGVPSSLPESSAERYRVCAEVAGAIKSVGYMGELSFDQLLYPTNEDSHKLLRFLLERLSGSFDKRRISNKDTGPICDSNEATVYHSSAAEGAVVSSSAGTSSSEKTESNCKKEIVEDTSEGPREYVEELCGNKDDIKPVDDKYVAEFEKKLASLQLQKSKLVYELEISKNQEKSLVEATYVKYLEVRDQEAEFELQNTAVDMTFDDQYSFGSNIKELGNQIEARRHILAHLESNWKPQKEAADDRNMALEHLIHDQKTKAQERLSKLKAIELETEAVFSEINKREVEHSELLVELEKLPKIPPRKSYIERITEITKNIWKQEADIHRILQETRLLQLESNTIQERLHRTYAVVEETIFRDVKNDPVRRQVYRLLTSIHDSFGQISEKLLATDRARREAVEQETKLTAISSRSFDIDKLQADLDSIKKENEFLEQQLQQKL